MRVLGIHARVHQMTCIMRRSDSLHAHETGEMVSACVSDRGVAFAWGCGTNAQLGNGARGLGTRAAGLEPAELTASQSEDEGLDELIAWRLDSAALRVREIVAMEFGGQHALVIARKR